MKSKSFAWLRAFMFAALVPVLSLGLVACESEGSDSEELENPGSEEFEDLGYIGGYAAVDLGLSVRWAAYNVGADSINVYGDYYAWGEIKPKKDYSQDTYLNTSFDVAQEVWGEGWRMPTRWEFDELCRKCTWEHVTVAGVKGVKATAPNGNSIFFPSGGLMMESEVVDFNFAGNYWSTTEDGYDAWVLMWYDDTSKPLTGTDNQVLGLLVRPVIM